MAVKITSVDKRSKCARHGVHDGDTLISINGKEIFDVLDYRYYSTADKIELAFINHKGKQKTVKFHNERGLADDLGLNFETYLMDKHQHCKNRCIFCFVDQMPDGMRQSLYFKDDDSRLSFLFGNYITLTAISEREVQRIIDMHISPINISVHTMNPSLRVKMMGNPNAAASLDILRRFAQAKIKMNTQLVLCPEINDGAELEFSLKELGKLYPAVDSIALVPIGLTKHRKGLYPLRNYTQAEAEAVIELTDSFNREFITQHGEKIAYCADEFYICAKRELPSPDYYDDYKQLENGVGMWTLLLSEFTEALDSCDIEDSDRSISLITGVAAFPLITKLSQLAMQRFPSLKIEVFEIKNDFFGHSVTVAGLITAGDIIKQIKGRINGDELILPSVMLKTADEPVFLDDISVSELSRELGRPIKITNGSGFDLLQKILGEV